MMKLAFALGVTLFASTAFAQSAEWKGKLQEDLNVYVKDFAATCGSTVKIDWTGGKLTRNPREPAKKGENAISVLCTCGLEAAFTSCENADVKKQFAALTEVQCKHGKGALSYVHKGNTLVIAVDPAYVEKAPADQRDDLKAKIIKETK